MTQILICLSLTHKASFINALCELEFAFTHFFCKAILALPQAILLARVKTRNLPKREFKAKTGKMPKREFEFAKRPFFWKAAASFILLARAKTGNLPKREFKAKTGILPKREFS